MIPENQINATTLPLVTRQIFSILFSGISQGNFEFLVGLLEVFKKPRGFSSKKLGGRRDFFKEKGGLFYYKFLEIKISFFKYS